MRLVGYVRVSTLEQADSGLSIAGQRERIIGWATAMGHHVVDIKVDAGVSSTVVPDDRPGWQEAMQLVVTKRVQGVVFTALDRVARSVLDVLTLAEKFNHNEWSFISIRDSLDTKSAVGRFTLTLLAGVAQLEREMIGDRTRAAMEQLKINRHRYSRYIPFGLKMAEVPVDELPGKFRRELVEDEVENEIISLAKNLIAHRANSEQMALALQEKFGDHPRTKKPWSVASVQTLRKSMRRSGAIKKDNVFGWVAVS